MKNYCWIIKHLLFAGFMAYVPLSGYANIHPHPSDNVESSQETNKFSLGPQEVLAVEEVASQIKEGLQDLGASDIRRAFVLPEKESISLDPTRDDAMVRVAFLDTVGECFMYNNITKEMVLCEEDDEALVKDSEEVLASSLSYTPVDSSFIPGGSLQTASLGEDFRCFLNDFTITLAYLGTIMIMLTARVGMATISGFASPVVAVASVVAVVGIGGVIATYDIPPVWSNCHNKDKISSNNSNNGKQE